MSDLRARSLVEASPSTEGPGGISAHVDIQPPRRRSSLVRTLSSVSFGMSVLAIILVYASLVSAIAPLRGVLEMTEMDVFRHWVFAALIGLFCLSLSLATLTRVRWSVINAGVLMVHAGLLMLCGGAWWYFATKVEGDTILLSPRIELLQSNGTRLPEGELQPLPGKVWQRMLPAFGGRVRVEVLETRSEQMLLPAEARVRITIGDEPPREASLRVNGPHVEMNDRLRLRLINFGPVHDFYDNETTALYTRAVDDVEEHMTPMPGLPIFRERFLDEGESLIDARHRPVYSKRTWPHLNILGLEIPTGWFEHWRLPIDVSVENVPFDVQVTGYLPYVRGFTHDVAPGGDDHNPGAEVELRLGEQSIRDWLLAESPTRSLLQTLVPFEYRRVRDVAERDALLEPLVGMHELTVEVRDPPLRRVYEITAGQTLEIEGTPYRLTVRELNQEWPLMTPGFERASSPVAIIEVTGADKSYTRTVVQRFPQLSQDIDEAGTRRTDGLYDQNLILHYRSAERGWLMLTAGPGVEPVLGSFDQSGSVERYNLTIGRDHAIRIGRVRLDFRLHKLIDQTRLVRVPVVEPIEQRRPSTGRPNFSAIRVRLTGRGEFSGWSESHWIPFSVYPTLDESPILVRPPGSEREYRIVYSRLRRPLGGELGAGRLDVEFFPGRHSVERWESFFAARHGEGPVQAAEVRTNQTYGFGPWTLFQSGAAQDHWSFTVLGVGNREGINAQIIACVLITFGCLYAFYVKPVLKRRRQAAALVSAAQRRRDADGAVHQSEASS